MRAIWRDTVLAQSDDTVVVEGNHYFPRDAVRGEHVRLTSRLYLCPKKGVARYLDVRAGGEVNRSAAWTYRHPFPWFRRIRGRVAFWKGVEVVP